jgi:hypothetical protein
MHHVEGLAVGQVGVGIDDHDLVDDAADLQGEPRGRAYDATAADDPNLPGRVLLVSIRPR